MTNMLPTPPLKPTKTIYKKVKKLNVDFILLKNSIIFIIIGVCSYGLLRILVNSGLNSGIIGFVLLPLSGLAILGCLMLLGIFSIVTVGTYINKNERQLFKEQEQYDKEYKEYEINLKKYKISRQTEAKRIAKEAKKKKELLNKQLDETEQKDRIRRQGEELKRRKELIKNPLDEAKQKDKTKRQEQAKKKYELLKKQLEEERKYKVIKAVEEEKKKNELIKNKIEEKKENNKLKYNWIEYKRILENNRIKKLYHFTDKENIPKIKKMGGLYSWWYLQQNNIHVPRPGSDVLSRKLDKVKGLENYVRVSFVKEHPMLFIALKESRIKNPVILEIDTEIIYWHNTKYSKENATKTKVEIDKSIEVFKKLRFDLFSQDYFQIAEYEKSFFQAEVLVWENIPANFILNLK